MTALRLCASPTGSALRGRDGDWLLQAEFQQRFAGHFHLLPAGEHLDGSSGSGADARANRRTLTASGDGPDDRSQSRAAADFLCGVLAVPLRATNMSFTVKSVSRLA